MPRHIHHTFQRVLVSLILSTSTLFAQRVYEIWSSEPAPNRGVNLDIKPAGGVPFDEDWEKWSYPIGNGYMGANVFGRTDIERIQLSEKTMANDGVYGVGGVTSFAELFLDFNHQNVSNYRRSLNLNTATATVAYDMDGTHYTRELFSSYPDHVLVIRLSADTKEKINLTVRPEIPYLNMKDHRTGSVHATGNLITLSGHIPFFCLNYEAQIKVLNEGGTVEAADKTIAVSNANTVTLLVTLGTNYEISEALFLKPSAKKLDPKVFPHEAVSSRIMKAEAKGYKALYADHLSDYQKLFNRVAICLNSEVSTLPTQQLLEQYKSDDADPYLEELMFQYGRYLLIASSREKTLPANLQGVWSQYQYTPWTGGYWHNINVQMNYWGAFNANLAETFEAYIAYFTAYQKRAEECATDYVRKHTPERMSDKPGGNGWTIGTNANAYRIGSPGGHSGPGTGGFTTKMLIDYYYFTQDKDYLKEVGYPALLSMSRFYSKTLVEENNRLLVCPSASPEQRLRDGQKPGPHGHKTKSGHYTTIGCTFDQGFVWENYTDTLNAAKILGAEDPFLDTIREELPKLDPILIGSSGQIKEYREEDAYSDIGDKHHRHISHLCTLYPGTLINAQTKDWMEAARKTLDFRGNRTTGWAMAHRMNCRARMKQGDEAHEVYRQFIRERTAPNLWTMHPPFQIDGNLGTMAGVAEMLLQSHAGYIELLPALPKAWEKTGFFAGLVARGNFVVSAKWSNGKLEGIEITSRSGGACTLEYVGLGVAKVKTINGKKIPTKKINMNRLQFKTQKGETYRVTL